MRLKGRTVVLLGLLSVAAGYGTPVHRYAKGGTMGTNLAAAQECLPRGADCTDTPVDCCVACEFFLGPDGTAFGICQ